MKTAPLASQCVRTLEVPSPGSPTCCGLRSRGNPMHLAAAAKPLAPLDIGYLSFPSDVDAAVVRSCAELAPDRHQKKDDHNGEQQRPRKINPRHCFPRTIDT